MPGQTDGRADRPYFIGPLQLPPELHFRGLENPSRRDNMRFDRIAKYENESLVETDDNLKGTLSETFSIRNTQTERAIRVGEKNKSTCRTIVEKFSYFKMKEGILEEAQKKKPRHIWIYQAFLRETVKFVKISNQLNKGSFLCLILILEVLTIILIN